MFKLYTLVNFIPYHTNCNANATEARNPKWPTGYGRGQPYFYSEGTFEVMVIVGDDNVNGVRRRM